MQSKELWPFVFFLGLLCFTWPLMSLAQASLIYYLHTVWALFILLLGWLVTIKKRGDKG